MTKKKYVIKENNAWKVTDTAVDGAIPFKQVEIVIKAYETELASYAFKNKSSISDLDEDFAIGLRCGDIECDAKDSCRFWENGNMFIDDEDVSEEDLEFDEYNEPEDYCNDDYEVVIKTNEARLITTNTVNIFIPDIEYSDERLCFLQPTSYDSLIISSPSFDESEELKNLWADYSYDELMKIMQLINEKGCIEPDSDPNSEYHVYLEMDNGRPKEEEASFFLKNDDDEWEEFYSLEDLQDAL